MRGMELFDPEEDYDLGTVGIELLKTLVEHVEQSDMMTFDEEKQGTRRNATGRVLDEFHPPSRYFGQPLETIALIADELAERGHLTPERAKVYAVQEYCSLKAYEVLDKAEGTVSATQDAIRTEFSQSRERVLSDLAPGQVHLPVALDLSAAYFSNEVLNKQRVHTADRYHILRHYPTNTERHAKQGKVRGHSYVMFIEEHEDQHRRDKSPPDLETISLKRFDSKEELVGMLYENQEFNVYGEAKHWANHLTECGFEVNSDPAERLTKAGFARFARENPDHTDDWSQYSNYDGDIFDNEYEPHPPIE